MTRRTHPEAMPHVLSLSLAVPFFLFITCFQVTKQGLCAPDPVTFHVAPSGDDAADGSRNHPFATLERARDAVRTLKKTDTASAARGVVVELESGVYRRTQPFVLSAEDSGVPGAPVVWKSRAMKGAHIDVGVT
ncbi:MAG: hypothetical protein ORN83_05100, partial [Chthoniobacteraceae bacterium]|nr:hypothetical protein [Chthoniobacteraceae bacterium]